MLFCPIASASNLDRLCRKFHPQRSHESSPCNAKRREIEGSVSMHDRGKAGPQSLDDEPQGSRRDVANWASNIRILKDLTMILFMTSGSAFLMDE
jgi:hypothetical protein